jgi:membrane protein YdbS with pleckstrin-like domain
MPNNLVNQPRQIELFAKLRRDDMRAVARLFKRRECRAGEEICRQGQPGHSMYLVESGELRVMYTDPQGIRQEVGGLGPGDYFGETSLLLGEPRDATVQAAQDSVLLHVSRDQLDQLLDERPAMRKDLQMRPDVAQKFRARQHHFKWQEEDEDIIVCEHRHNAVLLRNLLIPSIVLLVTLIVSIYWSRAADTTAPLVGGGGVSAVLLVFIVYLVMDHRDERYIVTNKRVVRREHTPLGRESRVDAPLRTIQDIQESQVGLLAQLYNYGDLIIETAGERAHVAFRELPNPERVREIIFEQIRRLQAGARVSEREAIRDDMHRHFGIQVTEKRAPAAPEPPVEKRRFRPAMLDWLGAPLRVFTYFLPPLRHEEGEIITWRKHWIALLKPIAIPSLLLLISTVGALILLVTLGGLRTLALIGYGIALVILLPWWLWKFDDWQNDIYQVTPTRIIDVERLPFYLREDRREASLGVIQNIQFEIPGTLGRLLNYGSVTIETAGAGAFTFDLVKDPGGVQSEIFRRMEAFQERQRQAAAEQHRSELLDWFAVYDKVRPGSQSSPSPQQET